MEVEFEARPDGDVDRSVSVSDTKCAVVNRKKIFKMIENRTCGDMNEVIAG
ncbi:MAG: hypothetical protein N2V77_01095 [Canidatus Methanoxibalbensis ujae]|nr:hypothetical protein [Candidatus Methanoxibalbensis ujae]MCW7077886.1 hypothetical protein [Candidatus Methanoxibalbensis ujae]